MPERPCRCGGGHGGQAEPEGPGELEDGGEQEGDDEGGEPHHHAEAAATIDGEGRQNAKQVVAAITQPPNVPAMRSRPAGCIGSGSVGRDGLGHEAADAEERHRDDHGADQDPEPGACGGEGDVVLGRRLGIEVRSAAPPIAYVWITLPIESSAASAIASDRVGWA